MFANAKKHHRSDDGTNDIGDYVRDIERQHAGMEVIRAHSNR
jgi:hypothetical protein